MPKTERDTVIDLDIDGSEVELNTLMPEASDPSVGEAEEQSNDVAKADRPEAGVRLDDDGIAPDLIGALVGARGTASPPEAEGASEDSSRAENARHAPGDGGGASGNEVPAPTAQARPAVAPPSLVADGTGEPTPAGGGGKSPRSPATVQRRAFLGRRNGLVLTLALTAAAAAVLVLVSHSYLSTGEGARAAVPSVETVADRGDELAGDRVSSVEVVVGEPRILEPPPSAAPTGTAAASSGSEGGESRPSGVLDVIASIIPIPVNEGGEVRGAERERRDPGRLGGTSLVAEQVRAAVSANASSVRRCHEREMRRTGGPIEAHLVVHLSVSRSGRVRRAEVEGDDISPRLASCIETAAGSWDFPEATAPTRVETPFSLTARP